MITVEEFMTTDLHTMGESDTIEDARKIMMEKNIRHIPVTDEGGSLLGLVTQRDILAATGPDWMTQGGDGANASLSDIMIKDVSVVHGTDSLRTAAIYMQSHKYGCLPVLSDGRLVGIITDSDFISIAINLIEQAELNEEGLGEGELGEEDII